VSVRLTFRQLLAFVAVGLPVVVALRFSIATIDLGYLIRAGEVTLDARSVLRTDVMTFTMAGEPWVNQQWGAGVLFALGYRAGSWELLALLRAILVGTTFALVYLACRASGAGARAAGWLTIGAFLVSLDGLALRAQSVGLCLLALTLWILASRERRPRLQWLLPLVVVLWVDAHGSFVLGPALVAMAWLEDLTARRPYARRTLAVALACLAATLLNPYGPNVYAYLVSLSTNPVVRDQIAEWRPTSPASTIGFLFSLSVVAVVVLAIRGRRCVPWPRIVALVVLFALAVTAVRGVFWWAISAPVLIAPALPERRERRDEPRALNTAIAAILVVVGVLLLPWFRPTYASDANSPQTTDGVLSYAPVGLTSRIPEVAPTGARVFAAQIWASWLEVAFPEHPVFVDSRIELFPAELWEEYDLVSDGRDGWQDVLDRWDIDLLLLSRNQQEDLIEVIERDGAPGWTVVHEDANGLLLVRAPAASGP
jgi:hypothetical protein